VLKKVNLFEEKDKKFKKYSVGMKQKLRIAQAIMEEPEILILDEPFNGVDRESVLKIREYLNDLKKQNKTVLLASHMSEDLQVLCDHIFKMELGRIIDENI
jgi:ABC-2 type transport system ATP-binding protein